MPSVLKILLYTTAVTVVLFGFTSYQAQPAQQAVAVHQQTAVQRWTAERMAELEQNTAGQSRTAGYEVCARSVRADYDDDPEQAYRWVMTLCH